MMNKPENNAEEKLTLIPRSHWRKQLVKDPEFRKDYKTELKGLK